MSKHATNDSRTCVVLISVALPLFFIGFSIGDFNAGAEALRPYLQMFMATLMMAWFISLGMALRERQLDRLAHERQRRMREALTDGVSI